MHRPSVIDLLADTTDPPPSPARHIMSLRRGPPAYLTVPSIIKLIGVADLRSSAAAMAPLVAVNDKLTDSRGFNPNYTWITAAKT